MSRINYILDQLREVQLGSKEWALANSTGKKAAGNIRLL